VLFAAALFLAWGSFLNVVAYRLMHGPSFFVQSSFCPNCKKPLAWYDLVPVLSWLILRGKCRNCQKPISWLYPFIELLTMFVILRLWVITPVQFLPTTLIFVSAIIVSIRTDIETMLLSRYATLYLAPLGILASFMGYLPQSGTMSIIGFLVGYGILWLIAKAFFKWSGQHGMGQGDLELLACIGAFIGPAGAWWALLAGSLAGSVAGLALITRTGKRWMKIPFGPFLGIGALSYLMFPQIVQIFMQF
jgi:leader peptidase (prepilin peptidase) / N-methyltransferase